MKQWKLLALGGGLFISMLAAPAQALNVFGECGGNAESKVCQAAASEQDATGLVRRLINLLLFGLGITAVVMIIIGGLKYVTSRGDPANVKSAKDTVLYAVVGLVVALFAYAIVNFVIASLR